MDRSDSQTFMEPFIARVNQRLQRIDVLLAELRQDPRDTELLRELMTMFHTLAGTGGTYGFYELSRHSRKGEQVCDEILRAQRPIQEEQLAALHALVQGLAACLKEEHSAAAHAMQLLLETTTQVPTLEVVVLEWFDEARERVIGQVQAVGLPARGVSTEQELLGIEHPIDAVLMDAGPVARNGFQLIKKLRSRPGGEQTAILLTGALPSFSDKVDAIRHGADAYFEQTADFSAVETRLQELLDRRKSRTGNILIVEDDPDQVTWMRAILSGAGYQVYSCKDPRFFEQEVALAKPDLILLDILMPNILGTDLARYIRQDENYRAVPIIILTGVTNDQVRVEAALAGGDLHLQKPVPARVLLTAVAGCLESARRRGTVTPIEVVEE